MWTVIKIPQRFRCRRSWNLVLRALTITLLVLCDRGERAAGSVVAPTHGHGKFATRRKFGASSGKYINPEGDQELRRSLAVQL